MSKYLNESKDIDDRIGQIGISTEGDKMQIIEYYGYDNIKVKFLDGNDCVVHTQYVNFLKGTVKNYNKVKYGKHGYLGQSNDKRLRDLDKKDYKEIFSIWAAMHERAGNYDGIHPSYEDVTISEEWWCFQNFLLWYLEHKYETGKDFLCLDKDLLIPGNRVYGPDTCCLIPNSINEIFRNYENYKHDDLPVGVSRRSDAKSIRYRGRTKSVDEYGNIIYTNKTFDNILDAFIFYKKHKEKYIKFLAEKYKKVLDKRVYYNLIEYEITTDYDFSKSI